MVAKIIKIMFVNVKNCIYICSEFSLEGDYNNTQMLRKRATYFSCSFFLIKKNQKIKTY